MDGAIPVSLCAAGGGPISLRCCRACAGRLVPSVKKWKRIFWLPETRTCSRQKLVLPFPRVRAFSRSQRSFVLSSVSSITSKKLLSVLVRLHGIDKPPRAQTKVGSFPLGMGPDSPFLFCCRYATMSKGKRVMQADRRKERDR